jgi:hypothetical protein
LGVRALTLPILLPVFLTRLDPQELKVWFLINVVLSLTTLSDLGFSHTFYRLIAFAMGGATRSDLIASQGASPDDHARQPNWQTVAEIFSVMVYMYALLAAVFLIGFLVIGTIAVYPAIEGLADPISVWTVWPIVGATASFSFFGSLFGIYLQGVDRIAITRRWDTLIQAGSVSTTLLTLLLGGGLATLLLLSQFWAVLGVVRNWLLCRSVHGGQLRKFGLLPYDRALLGAVFKPSWRSGLGAIASFGGVKLCVILLTRTASAEQAAMTLLAIQLMDQLVAFSMVPFYVKLPRFAVLRFQGARDQLVAEARRAMFLSHLCFILPGIIIAMTAAPLLEVIGSSVQFVDVQTWSLLLLGYWLARYGAMHIQLYSTTNHIIWHYANGLSSAVLIAIFAATVERLGIYAFCIANIIAFGFVYSPIAVRYSLRDVKMGLWQFEQRNLLLAAMLLLFVSLAFAASLTGTQGHPGGS